MNRQSPSSSERRSFFARLNAGVASLAAMAASAAAPAFRRVRNERRSGDDGDCILMCTSLSVRIRETENNLITWEQPRLTTPKTPVTYLHRHLSLPNHEVTASSEALPTGPLINSIRSSCASHHANGTKALTNAPRKMKKHRTATHKNPRCATPKKITKGTQDGPPLSRWSLLCARKLSRDQREPVLPRARRPRN